MRHLSSKRSEGVDPIAVVSKHYPSSFREHATKAVAPLEPYFEEDPTIKEWLLDHRPTAAGTAAYLKSFFPFTRWIYRYNWQWMMGDMIGGVTLGFVVVPQAMAYSLLAGLRPEYGLYTSFTGAAIYWMFGTSKDIAIGATAVVSLLVGRIYGNVKDRVDVPPEQVAKTISALAGLCLIAFGMLRLDWLIELIPHVAIAAFVTGAAITITITQIPSLLGITGVNTRGEPYQVFIETCKALPRTKVDAAVGITAIIVLQAIKWYCDHMAERQRHRVRLWDTLSSMRMTFIILLFTLISFLVNRDLPEEKATLRILGEIPTGFSRAGPPSFDPNLIRVLAPELPALIIIIIIEHIAIGKSFARINNYNIVTSQEIISAGAANFLGPFLGGYPATGSFAGTAVLSKAGVRTPAAGVYNAFILLLALYALTSVFRYIPMAALAGLIVHAVSNLVTPPSVLLRYWLMAPLDVVIYFVGVLIAVFNSLEVGIYATVATSLAVVLVRLAKARGRFIGRATVYEHGPFSTPGSVGSSTCVLQPREVFLPLDRKDGSNPVVDVSSPFPGVFIYRFTEGCNYINQAQYMDNLVAHIKSETRQTEPVHYKRPGDRPWNESPPSRKSSDNPSATKPLLRAVVFDFSAVSGVDTTSVEGLMVMRTQLDKWAKPAPVEWHFAGIHNSRWTRRALASAGFGYPSAETGGFKGDVPNSLGCWVPAFDVGATATAKPLSGIEGDADLEQQRLPQSPPEAKLKQEAVGKPIGDEGLATKDPHETEEEEDIRTVMGSGTATPGSAIRSHDRYRQDTSFDSAAAAAAFTAAPGLFAADRFAPVYGVDRPFFHVDLASAVHNAVESARRRDGVRGGGGNTLENSPEAVPSPPG